MNRSSSPFKDRLTKTREDMLIWQQERTILDITELICELMKQAGVTRSELARRLHSTKGHVTQLLDGSRNMTVRTISDVFAVLGYEFRPACARLGEEDRTRLAADLRLPWPGRAPAASPFRFDVAAS